MIRYRNTGTITPPPSVPPWISWATHQLANSLHTSATAARGAASASPTGRAARDLLQPALLPRYAPCPHTLGCLAYSRGRATARGHFMAWRSPTGGVRCSAPLACPRRLRVPGHLSPSPPIAHTHATHSRRRRRPWTPIFPPSAITVPPQPKPFVATRGGVGSSARARARRLLVCRAAARPSTPPATDRRSGASGMLGWPNQGGAGDCLGARGHAAAGASSPQRLQLS